MNNIAIMDMKWAEEKDIQGENYCVCCGRKLNPNRKFAYYVEVIDGGAMVAAPGLGPDPNDPGYMGCHEIGAGCARKHFSGFFHKQEIASAAK